MKRIIFSLALIMCVSFVFAQKVKIVKDEVDKFENTRTVVTDWIKISAENNMWIYTRMSGNSEHNYISIRAMVRDACAVHEGNELLFLDTNGEKHIMKSVQHVVATIGGGAVGLIGSKGWGFICKYKGDTSFLGTCDITDFRIETTEFNLDHELSAKQQKTLKALYTSFMDYLSKHP